MNTHVVAPRVFGDLTEDIDPGEVDVPQRPPLNGERSVVTGRILPTATQQHGDHPQPEPFVW